MLEPIVGDVVLGDSERVGRDVDCVDFCIGKCVRGKDRQTPGSGAEIEHRCDLRRVLDPWDELVDQELGNERPRNDDAFVDVETKIPEPRFAHQVRDRHAIDRSALDQCMQRRPLGRGEPRIDVWIERVEREMQMSKHEEHRLVPRVAGAVPEGDAGLAHPAHRVTQPVTDRFELGGKGLRCHDITRASGRGCAAPSIVGAGSSSNRSSNRS